MKVRRKPNVRQKSIPTQVPPKPEHITHRPYYIYGLAELDGHVFYVGMTTDPKGRYQQHLAGDDNQRKTGMIRHVYSRVEMRILDTAMDLEHAQQLESFWILYHILDHGYLTNTHMGAALDLIELDDEHTEKLIAMLQRQWGKDGAARWQNDGRSSMGRGWWDYMKSITVESEAWRHKP